MLLTASVYASSPGQAALLSSSLQPPSLSTALQPEPVQSHTDKLAEQRKLYQRAQTAFKKHRYTEFKWLSARLIDYPLHPYLEYKALLRQPAKLTSRQIHHFLQNNDDTVIGERFRQKLIRHSARTGNWQRLVDIYRPGYGVSAQCHYLNALLHLGQKDIAYSKIENLWLSAVSRPKACDTVFANWEAAGHKSPQLIWQRFKLAMSVSNRKLAAYLIKSMPRNDAKVARMWLKVHRKPQLVLSPALLNIQHPDKDAILMHGIKRLSYKDMTKAIAAYQQLKLQHFNLAQHAELIRHIGLRLAREHSPEAGLWLARIPASYANKPVQQWRIRTAIRQGDWYHVIKHISQLSLQEQSSYRWQYWWAYANEQLGKLDDAAGIYQYLANKRSYYGFLAADHLHLPYAFEDKPVAPSAQVVNHVLQRPEASRAREFYLLGEIIPARREWHKLILHINNEEKLAASKIAQSWNWHDRAIVTMGKTRYRDDIELRFPLHLDKKVLSWSSQRNIDPAWTYAIIRRESAFMSDARSPVGAVGLMQLMPNTARQTARYFNVRYRGRKSLLTSSTNISLGTGYLERMMDRLSSQQVLATAAYNAGPNRVTTWLPELHNMDAIRWIETIPYAETREYVSNVLAYMAIYEHRMNRSITRLSQRMPPIPARQPLPVAISNTDPGLITPPSKAKVPPKNDPS